MLSTQYKLIRFIKKAGAVHDEKYNYEKVSYVDAKTKVIIICPIHGEFEQTPDGHVQGRGCKTCGIEKRADSKRLGQEEFIKRASAIHEGKYDYSSVVYVRNNKKVIIICPIDDHGPFKQTPANHLNGQGCNDCGIEKRTASSTKTTEEFISDAKRIHGDLYTYDNVDYKGAHENVNITCREHLDFPQAPTNHLMGKGCPSCGVLKRAEKRRLQNKDFIEKAVSVHGARYDYSRVSYRRNDEAVTIICRDHGPFDQLPHNHWNGKGCNDCGVIETANKKRLRHEDFLLRSERVHGDYYDYSKVEYVRADRKVEIICPIHGEFTQTPAQHWQAGCEKCGYVKTGQARRLGTANFIKKAKEIHGDLYDYSDVKYSTNSVPVKIICKLHNVFSQAPFSHLQGAGCPSCKNKTEGKILTYLQSFALVEHQFRLKNLTYDFYLPEYNLIIERDGEQHYYVIAAWTKLEHEQQMQIQQEKDRKRTEIAKAHGFNIARLPYWLSDKHSAECTPFEKREIANILAGTPSYPDIPVLEHAELQPMPK